MLTPDSSPERPVNSKHNPLFRNIEFVLKQLLEINPITPSDQISRKLDLESIDAVREMAIPGEPREVSEAMHEAFIIFENRMRLDHPNCFGYIPSCPSPLARLGDTLTSIFNVNAAIWNISSGPTVVEHSLIRWLAAQTGLPSSAGGCFVSGGSMANLTAIVAARDNMLPKGRIGDGVVYLSDQTHASIQKGLHITGFSDTQIRVIPTDSSFRLDVEALRRAIILDRNMGHLPFLLIASSGTTNTGSIDPLHELADLAQDHNLWLHVDGAYGASICLSTKHKHLVDGIGRADSISWDGHKWLFQTYGCGMILVRNASTLQGSFKVDADYIRTSLAPDGTTNIYNMSPELSRPSRAISLWFTLRVLGHRRIGEMIDHGFELALAAEAELRQLANWEVVTPATASIVVFRYNPPDIKEEELDLLNATISKRLLDDNIAAVLTTIIRGRTVLRLCVINPTVQSKTVARILQQMNLIAESELCRKREGRR